MKKLIFIALFVNPFFSVADADGNSCKGYIGTTVSPISFNEAYNKVSVFSPKGEFETIAEYEARTKDIKIPSQLIIAKKADIKSSIGRDLIFYNAENNILKISEFAFHNINIGQHLISKHDTPEIDFDYSSSFYHSVPFSETKISTEYYSASNSYGTKTEVQRNIVNAELLIDPRKAGVSVSMFKSLYPYSLTSEENNNVIGEVKLVPEEAKSIKDVASLAFVVEPSKPYKTRKTYIFPEAKTSRPYENKYTTDILIAKIQCGLWLDANSKVIGAYPVNFKKSK